MIDAVRVCICAHARVSLCLLICKIQTHSLNYSDLYVQLPWLSVKCCNTARFNSFSNTAHI